LLGSGLLDSGDSSLWLGSWGSFFLLLVIDLFGLCSSFALCFGDFVLMGDLALS